MKATFRTVLNILLVPSEAFVNLRQQPRWIAVFATFAVVSGACIALSTPFTKHAALASLSGAMSGEELDRVVSLSEHVHYVASLVVPLGLLGKWLLAAAFLYACVVILDGDDPLFRNIFATVVHAEGILVLMALVNLFLLYLKGPEAIQDVTDLQAIVGLDIFLADPSSNIPLFTLLNGVNLFSLWYIVALGKGISIVAGVSRLASYTMVATFWLVGLGCQFGIAAIGTSLRAAVID